MKHLTWTSLGLAVAACACSSTSDSRPTAAQYDDTAQAVAATAASMRPSSARAATANATDDSSGDLVTMSDTLSLSAGTLPLGLSLGTNGHFQGSHLGLACDYALMCKSSSGSSVSCGATADQAAVEVAWSGTLGTEPLTAQVVRTGNWTVTGLRSGVASFSGQSTFSFAAAIQSSFRPSASAMYSFDASATYRAARLDTATHEAVGGSIDYDIHAEDAVTSGTGSASTSASFEVHGVLTFQADHAAQLVLDGDQYYALNTETGVIVRVAAP